MQAKEIQKYLIAVFAACFIGLGSGFLSLSQYMFDRDKEAAKISIEFETLANMKLDRNTDCAKAEEHKEKCKYAFYSWKATNIS